MLETLLYLNEDLASSIALRYIAYINKFVQLALHVVHVEEADTKERAGGTGWVRRTWEDGIAFNGRRLMYRMLRTENIDCQLAGPPKVFVGDRETEITYELCTGGYKLFVEGYLNTDDPDKFYKLIRSPLYKRTSCPVLMVKNLSVSKKLGLLCSENIDPEFLVEKSIALLGDTSFMLDIVYFKFKKNETLQFLDKKEACNHLKKTEALLTQSGKSVNNVNVVSGTPEQVGDFLKEYALVAAPFPDRRDMLMETIANSLASVLLIR